MQNYNAFFILPNKRLSHKSDSLFFLFIFIVYFFAKKFGYLQKVLYLCA